ncbi:YdcF family protein [Mangrovibacillus sp. Mu-81]|jgi:DUF218 domain|uniref:YdcF family protein n=1 Tax=Mangrovibacillus sp. Mu-81 TaxID=3121478 RepID=UPI002FE45ACA
MKPIIHKEIEMPELNQEQLDYITALTFSERNTVRKCDAIFVFSGTHPGHWENAIDAYNRNLARKIIVTGGRSVTAIAHPEWEGRRSPNVTEASVIISYLLEAGIPEEEIIYEDQSRNSLENVICAKDIIDFTSINSLLVICKSHAAGRQIRTLMKHFPEGMAFIPYSFDTKYRDTVVSRSCWMNTEIGRNRVWAEYLRILHYGNLGHLVPLSNELVLSQNKYQHQG